MINHNLGLGGHVRVFIDCFERALKKLEGFKKSSRSSFKIQQNTAFIDYYSNALKLLFNDFTARILIAVSLEMFRR